MKGRITKKSALKHLELLYSLNGIGKLASGDFMIAYDDGWAACSPDDAAEDLSASLEDVDLIRAKICEYADKYTRLPVPEIQIGDTIIYMETDASSQFDPEANIELMDGSEVCIKNIQYPPDAVNSDDSLKLEEQFFQLQHYKAPSNEDIDFCRGNLSTIVPVLTKILSVGVVEGNEHICPVCGAKLDAPTREDGDTYARCHNCRSGITVYNNDSMSIESPNNDFWVGAERFGENVRTRIYISGHGDEDGQYFASYNSRFEHQITSDNIRHCASLGYNVAKELCRKHSEKAMLKDCNALWDEAVRKADAEKEDNERNI